jgi:ADP-ribosylglycohydrolase
VGDVILKGKKQYWERGANWFYHRGMSAGENTLEGVITRLITNVLVDKGFYDHDEILDRYIKLMTTPDAHNDTYAGTGHRMFFANYANGKPPRECPDNDGHNTDALDGLVNLPPVVFCAMTQGGRDAVFSDAQQCVSLFRKSEPLKQYSSVMSALLVALVEGEDLKKALSTTGAVAGIDLERAIRQSGGQDPMTACYLPSSFPSMLQLAYKYSHSPEEALLANTNTGGENVARGAVLGAVMGAAHGMKGLPPHLIKGLKAHKEIEAEIDAFIGTLAAKAGVKQEL